mgnify:CR=1 FL=1
MNTRTNITPENIRAIHNCVAYAAECLRANNTGSHADIYLSNELNLAHKSVASMAHDLYVAWDQLPDGSALKHLYADDVWHPEPDLMD